MSSNSNAFFARIEARLKGRRVELEAKVAGAMSETMDDAVAAIQDALLLAITKTGILRAAGLIPDPYGFGEPGRFESGAMWWAVDRDVEYAGDKVFGRAGWLQPEPYYFAQEEGTGRIPAADTLPSTFPVIRATLMARLNALKKETR